MVDKNRNGIPDDKENGGKPKARAKNTFATRNPNGTLQPSLVSGIAPGSYVPEAQEVYAPSTRYGGLFGNIANTANDITRMTNNFWGSEILGERTPLGGGRGDAKVGSNPVDAIGRPARQRGGNFQKGAYQGGAQDPEMTLADYLAMASQLIGGGGGVNFDPQRQTARQNAAENDSRLEAMYRQLRGSIDADAPVLQQAYQGAIDSTAANNTNAQAQAQAATDSANARNNEVLANLGIEQAAGNIIQNGTDLNSQTAQRIGDMATRGQAAGDRLVSNQATALQHNTNIGNAAGLEGNLQRAANQAKLNALLAEIDMEEQQQNASLADNRFSQQMGMAQQLLDFDRYNQEREDNLQMSAAELAAKGQNSLPDLGSFLQALGINPQDIAKNPSNYGSLLSSLTKFSLQP